MASKINLSSANPTEEEKQTIVEALRQKLQGIKTVKNINTDEDYLLRWLYSTEFDVETSFLRMKDYHENMVENPTWFQKESPLNRKSSFEMNAAIMIPAHDKEGRPIYISKIGNLDPDQTTFADEACIDDIWYEYILDKNPEIAKIGLCVILDLGGISWKYLKMLNYKDCKLGLRKLSCLPFKELKLHCVNNSKYTKLMLKIVQPFIPEESKKQMFFHFDNCATLYDYIDKDNLPPEYGGYNKINHKKIYEKLFDKADAITENFRLHRNVIKS